MKIRNLLIGCAALVSTVGIAVSAGLFWGYPIVGQGTYCISYQNPTVVNGVVTSQGTCTSTAPAGPSALTGNELLIADTQLPGGQTPQTVYVPANVLSGVGQGANRNALIGADFQTNLWQRGTTPISATTAATAAYSADRWAVYSSGNTLTITKDVTAADVLPSAGVNGIMKVTRPSGTNTTSICVGQVLPNAESARFVGREAVFSFWAEALAGYLQTNSALTATIAVYTAADSATPNTNTDAFFKGTIAGYTVLNGVTPSTVAVPTTSNTTVGTPLTLTTSLARYSVAAYVPPQVLVSSTLTNVIGIGVTLCTGTYPASTGVATDGFAFGNAQLEETSPGTATGTTLTAAPNTAPGSFSRYSVSEDANAQLSYSYIVLDGATTIRYAAGFSSTNALAQFYIQYPVEMREVPTLAVGTTVSFSVLHQTTTSACGTSIGAVSASGTTVGSGLLCTTGGTALTAGEGSLLVGANTGSRLVFSAEP